jgi:hypothetical protein
MLVIQPAACSFIYETLGPESVAGLVRGSQYPSSGG